MASEGFITCLWFDGNAEEAANYYVSIFKDAQLGEITRSTEAGPGPVGSVVTVEFTLNGQRFVGLNGGPQYTFSEAISFQILCADQDEIDHYWSALTDGGHEVACGWCKDRYGLSWQVVPTELLDMIRDSDPTKAARAMQAMLAMTKFDLAALRQAHAGTH